MQLTQKNPGEQFQEIYVEELYSSRCQSLRPSLESDDLSGHLLQGDRFHRGIIQLLLICIFGRFFTELSFIVFMMTLVCRETYSDLEVEQCSVTSQFVGIR
jgi:hypothetical protein